MRAGSLWVERAVVRVNPKTRATNRPVVGHQHDADLIETCSSSILMEGSQASCGHSLRGNVGWRQAPSPQSGAQSQWEAFMARRNGSIQAALLASGILAWPAMAADVTPERLLNPDREPQN
jgi:hypothetical protein